MKSSKTSHDKIPYVKNTKSIFHNQWINLVEKHISFPNAEEQYYYSLSLPHYVCIIATTKEGKFPLVRQYRPAVEKITWEFPSGIMEENENPVSCAGRELLEETGYSSSKTIAIGRWMTDVGRLQNNLFGFHCPDCVPSDGRLMNEGIEVCTVSRSELEMLIATNEFNFALHLAVWGAFIRMEASK